MKYIRTKDGIMRIDFEIETELPAMIGIHTEECEDGEYRGIEVIDQADAIEELCDEFVVREFHFGDSFPIKTSPHNSYNTYPLLESAKEHYENLSKYRGRSLQDLYAAIWTDKGLQFVAKMNEKGVLELL